MPNLHSRYVTHLHLKIASRHPTCNPDMQDFAKYFIKSSARHSTRGPSLSRGTRCIVQDSKFVTATNGEAVLAFLLTFRDLGDEYPSVDVRNNRMADALNTTSADYSAHAALFLQPFGGGNDLYELRLESSHKLVKELVLETIQSNLDAYLISILRWYSWFRLSRIFNLPIVSLRLAPMNVELGHTPRPSSSHERLYGHAISDAFADDAIWRFSIQKLIRVQLSPGTIVTKINGEITSAILEGSLDLEPQPQ